MTKIQTNELQKRFHIKTIDETSAVIDHILKNLKLPSLMLLNGNLGSGKTTLAKYLLERLGIAKNEVKSPTYTLINNFQTQYQGRLLKVNHLDLYRLKKKDPILLEEIFQLISDRESLTLVEWPEKLDITSHVPKGLQLFEINIEITEGNAREFDLKIKA